MLRIITVAYQSPEKLLSLGKSIKANVKVPFEWIIWNNGELPLLENAFVSLGFRPVIVNSERNLGFGKGANQAAAFSTKNTPSSLFFVNPDACLLSPVDN